jgi:hypothetical protein
VHAADNDERELEEGSVGRLIVAATLVIALGAGCGIHSTAGPVPVEGPRAALDSLSGDWAGTYRASGARRHGILRFSLRPGADTAHGEVEITFDPLRLSGDPPDEDVPRAPCRVLDIALVRMDAGTVRGTVAPHWDPDCECQTSAVFEGRLSGPDKVEGTFTSRRAPDGPVLLSGSWVAERR